jgi:hypothetical protein
MLGCGRDKILIDWNSLNSFVAQGVKDRGVTMPPSSFTTLALSSGNSPEKREGRRTLSERKRARWLEVFGFKTHFILPYKWFF